MTPTLIICGTIFVLFCLSLFVTKGLVDKYLDIRKDTYQDMDVLHSNKLDLHEEEMAQIRKELDGYRNLVTGIKGSHKEIKEDIAGLVVMKEDVDSIKGKIAAQTVGNTFAPRRRG